jgi:hypothetical protein
VALNGGGEMALSAGGEYNGGAGNNGLRRNGSSSIAGGIDVAGVAQNNGVKMAKNGGMWQRMWRHQPLAAEVCQRICNGG